MDIVQIKHDIIENNMQSRRIFRGRGWVILEAKQYRNSRLGFFDDPSEFALARAGGAPDFSGMVAGNFESPLG
jgi:hypothetical protein